MDDQILTRKSMNDNYDICQFVIDDVLYEGKVHGDEIFELTYGVNFVRYPHLTLNEVKEKIIELLHKDALKYTNNY